MEVEFSSTDDMTEDMVEDFARQLDEGKVQKGSLVVQVWKMGDLPCK